MGLEAAGAGEDGRVPEEMRSRVEREKSFGFLISNFEFCEGFKCKCRFK